MAPKKKQVVSKRSDQYFSRESSDLINALGADDLDDVQVGKLHKQAYKLRRLKLQELEFKLKNLLNTSKVTTEIREQIGTLAREIKAVVLTDPRETFKYDSTKYKSGNFKKNLKIGGETFGGWYQTTAQWYKEGKPKNFEAHHKGGLDSTWKGILGKSDSALMDLHANLRSVGRALGNNPLNRIFLRKGHHQGRPRTGGVESTAVHPLLDLTSPNADKFMQILDETIDQRVPTTDWDLPEGRKIFPPLPDPGEFGWDADQYKALLDHEYSIADSIPSQIGPEEELWSRSTAKRIGPTKAKILKTFVNRHPDPNTWPEGTRDLLKSGDAEGIMRLTDQIKAAKEISFQQNLANMMSGKTNINLQTALRNTKNIVFGKTLKGTVTRGVAVLNLIDTFDPTEATEKKAANIVKGRTPLTKESAIDVGKSYAKDLKETGTAIAKTLPFIAAGSQIGSTVAPVTTSTALGTLGPFSGLLGGVMVFDSLDNIFFDGKTKQMLKKYEPGYHVEVGKEQTSLPGDFDYKNNTQGSYQGISIPSIK